jgi:hypothetical protein
MSTSDITLQPAWHDTPEAAPQPGATCRCAAHDVVAWRDEDGDWTCCGCGRPIEASATSHPGVRALTVERMLPLG